MKINLVFLICKAQFFTYFLVCPTFRNWKISVGHFKQEKRLAEDSTDAKAEGMIAESMSIRKCFPIDSGTEIPNSHHYLAVRKYQSPSANPSLHSATMQKITTCCCYHLFS